MNQPAVIGQQPSGIILSLIGAIGFSTKAIFVKLGYRYGIDPVTALSLRLIMAWPFYILMFVLSFTPGKFKQISPRQWWGIIFMGILGYYLSSLLDFAGLQYISAGLERLILFLYPTIVVFIGVLFFKQPLGRPVVIALIITYLGLVAVFAAETLVLNRAIWLGMGLVFLSAVTYAVYIVGTGSLVNRLGSGLYTSLAISVSTILVVIHYSLLYNVDHLLSLPPPVYWYSLGMAIFSTVLPTWFMAEGIKRLGANKNAIISSLGPVSTIVLAAIFLGEPVILLQIVGTVLVLVGVLVIGRNKRPTQSLTDKTSSNR